MYVSLFFFFFFKQKTAYEMRISDWSSDVCSSDLEVADTAGFHTYGVLWGPEQIAWTYDGIVVAQTQTPADMHEPMYMLVNLGLGGFTGTPGAALDEGVQMKVDYIRAYAPEDDGAEEPAPQPQPELPAGAGNDSLTQPEERRVGKEWVRKGRIRGS